MKQTRCLPLLLLAICVASAATAGPNRGGTLLIHADPQVQFCDDNHDYCPTDPPSACEDIVSSVSGDGIVLFYVLAAFSTESAPRVSAVTFGLQYDPPIRLVSGHSCADFELSMPDWPASRTGTALTWAAPQTARVVPVYWFAGYSYGGAAARLALTRHPRNDEGFADDSTPARVDGVHAYGVLGFNLPGAAPCPVAPLPERGACCHADGTCTAARTIDECAEEQGTFAGDGSSCEPNRCRPTIGACCTRDGDCRITTGPECEDALDLFMGFGSSCDPNPCPLPTGACCSPLGECVVTRAEECAAAGGSYRGDFTECVPQPCLGPTGACCWPDGRCLIEPAVSCEAAYQGDETTCDPNPCPIPTGACCLADGQCEQSTRAQCADRFGEYQGDESECPTVSCVSHFGACCRDGECMLVRDTLCEGSAGEFLGGGTVCDPNPCPIPPPHHYGACCRLGYCFITTDESCAEGGGGYQGDGTTCEAEPCPYDAQVGACCWSLRTGECAIRTEAWCAGGGGIYHGDGSSCEPELCPHEPRVACCLPTGECRVLFSSDCSSFEGTSYGEGLGCDPDPCPQVARGACCLGVDVGCEVITEFLCAAMRGTYLGDASACDPSVCWPAAGACCLPDGRCQFTFPENCSRGVFHGAGTTCDIECPQLSGACCFYTGACEILNSPEECVARNGVFHGGGTGCSPQVCGDPPMDIGACCLADGTCVQVQHYRCDPGTYMGDGVICIPDLCTPPRPGACCAPDGTCLLTQSAQCIGAADQGYTYRGDGSTCEPNPCEIVPQPNSPTAVHRVSWGSLKGRYRD